MEPLISTLFAQVAPKASCRGVTSMRCQMRLNASMLCSISSNARTTFHRTLTSTSRHQVKIDERPHETPNLQDNSYSQPAHKVSQNVEQAEKDHFARVVEDSKERQTRSPWMREGSDRPPVARNRSAGAMTKGKLLTTPSRMLKLILPLTTRDANKDRKDVEPLALLVHPQQPLSYLERLIQSELPMLKDGEKERSPHVTFRAEDSMEEDIGSGESAVEKEERDEGPEEEYEFANMEEMKIDGEVARTGKLNTSKSDKDDANAPSGPKEQPPQAKDPDHPNFVRWSPSTEIGDFIRDAARGKEFSVDIEDTTPIYVGVPSFADRTYYLRMRLRKTAQRIAEMADVKKECDDLAHRGAKRVAQGGFMGLLGWWGVVYWLTFRTSLGWDVMEPVTYLVGLSGLIGGYMWFLYHNREVSYRSAMNFTVSRRQAKLYEKHKFEVGRWEYLIEEGNRLRREIRMVADEYDVEWDERKEEGDERVAEALREDRRKKKERQGQEEKEEDEGDG